MNHCHWKNYPENASYSSEELSRGILLESLVVYTGTESLRSCWEIARKKNTSSTKSRNEDILFIVSFEWKNQASNVSPPKSRQSFVAFSEIEFSLGRFR